MRRLLPVLLLVAGCASATRDTGTPPAIPAPAPVAALPSPATGKYAPARGVAMLTGAQLADTDACEGCHTDVAAQWRASAHSFASFNNPVYRAVVEKFRKDVGNIPSRFCGGCHDLALIIDGALDTTVAPDDARAFAGVNCRSCHGITEVTPDGNGSWSITNVAIPLPKPNDADSVARHKAALHLQVRDQAAMCGSCHRAFLGTDTGNPNFLVGQDDFTPWQRSAYAGSNLERLDDVQPATCQQCHMPLEPAVLDDPAAKQGQIHSHRFLGGHTWMSAMRADPDQLARAQANLRGAASIDVMLADASTPARPRLDVVVRNLRVGHRFPGGVMDAQDAWIEITVHDASGRLLAEAGTAHAATGADPTAHRFKSAMVDEHGQPLAVRETDQFRAGAYNATIAPRDATVVEYDFPAPLAATTGPLTVRARLRHRSRGLELQAAACADSRAERGRAFAAHSKELLGTALDPCAAQPITDVADTTTTITLAADAGAWTQAPAPDWRRQYEHGLGLTHVLQERLDEATRALDRALAAAPTPRDRAIVLFALGTVAARQGRVDQALALLDQAGDDPAVTYMKGEAYALVWRWSSAAPLLLQAALTAPLDDAAWARAAVALGSAGRHPAALAAAMRGLAAQPRNQDLLRIQALALRALNAPPAVADAAMAAYLDHRVPDAGPRFKGLCSKTVPGCALERNPVHVHVMRLDSPPGPR